MPKATTHSFKLREKNIDGAKAFLIRKEDKHENPVCSGCVCVCVCVENNKSTAKLLKQAANFKDLIIPHYFQVCGYVVLYETDLTGSSFQRGSFGGRENKRYQAILI